LAEALEQQTATGEILGVISQSPTDVQPALDAMVRSAVRLCNAAFAIVFRFDGEFIHFVAHHNCNPGLLTAYRQWFPRRPLDDRLVGRAILERQILNIADITAEFRFAPGQREQGHRSVLLVPMLRDGVPIGVIGVSRMEAEPFPDAQVDLLKTFADQAVIAIENVRLFAELQQKNEALTQAHAQVSDALEQQTATAEILRVISSSPTDVQPVFDTIVRNALRLCDGLFSDLYRFDGELIHSVAQHNFTPEALEAASRLFPTRPSRAMGSGRAILARAVVREQVQQHLFDLAFVGADGVDALVERTA